MKTSRVLLAIGIVLLFTALGYGAQKNGFIIGFVCSVVGCLLACTGSLLTLRGQLILSLNIGKTFFQYLWCIGGIITFIAGIAIIYIGNSGSFSLFCFKL
jgi:hypothetical protein